MNIPIGSDTKWAYWNRKDEPEPEPEMDGACPNYLVEYSKEDYDRQICSQCDFNNSDKF